jgi:hypothetical protein
MTSRDILLQVLARLVALEGKIDKLQESHADGVEKLRREVAGLREAIGPQVLLEVQSKG